MNRRTLFKAALAILTLGLLPRRKEPQVWIGEPKAIDAYWGLLSATAVDREA